MLANILLDSDHYGMVSPIYVPETHSWNAYLAESISSPIQNQENLSFVASVGNGLSAHSTLVHPTLEFHKASMLTFRNDDFDLLSIHWSIPKYFIAFAKIDIFFNPFNINDAIGAIIYGRK